MAITVEAEDGIEILGPQLARADGDCPRLRALLVDAVSAMTPQDLFTVSEHPVVRSLLWTVMEGIPSGELLTLLRESDQGGRGCTVSAKDVAWELNARSVYP